MTRSRLLDTLERRLRKARKRRDLVATILLEQRIKRDLDGAFLALLSR